MEFLRFIQGCLKGLRHSLLVETPSPVSPSPYQGEGELIERGASPLLYTPLGGQGIISTRFGGRGGKGGFKGGFASLPYPSPSPLAERYERYNFC